LNGKVEGGRWKVEGGRLSSLNGKVEVRTTRGVVIGTQPYPT